MNDFFGPGGLLERRLEDYEFRPSQVRMAEAVHEALEKQNHVIIEAGTGTGKTLAYLLPALAYGRRILVSTGTKTLQDQIFYKDIPLLEKLLGRPIRAAYLKGRNNYLCRLKLETAQPKACSPRESFASFQSILDWAQDNRNRRPGRTRNNRRRFRTLVAPRCAARPVFGNEMQGLRPLLPDSDSSEGDGSRHRGRESSSVLRRPSIRKSRHGRDPARLQRRHLR